LYSNEAIFYSCFLLEAALCYFTSAFTDFVFDTIVKFDLVIKFVMVLSYFDPCKLQAKSDRPVSSL
jgi:hypothetical protein